MENKALRELYRGSFKLFAMRFIKEVMPGLELEWNWHHDLICDRLERVARGEIPRLLICVPPRSLKSLLCSVLFPAWVLGIRPSDSVLCVSYAQPLAEGFARQSRQIMESAAYKTAFDTRVSREKRAVDLFETTAGGMRIATSVGGTVTGRGGDLIVLDDLMKPEEAASEVGRRNVLDWVRGTLASRPNSKLRARYVCVMQRLHESDIAAEFIGQGWAVLSLPAIAIEAEEHHYNTPLGPEIKRREPGDVLHPEREPLHVLEDLQKQMGTFRFQPQYQQDPVPEEGNIFRTSWVKTYGPGEDHSFNETIQSWDTASKDGQHNDFSVCVTLGIKNDHIYLRHVHREKLTVPDLMGRVIELSKRFNADRVLIEDQASGIALIQLLQRAGFYKAIAFKPKGSKVERLHGVTAMFESGYVLLPESADWLETYLHEMRAFPRGRNDDMVDATTQGLEYLRVNGLEPAITTFYRREVEAERAFREEKSVRMRAPDNGSNRWGFKDGTWINIPDDRIVMVTPENVPSLRLAGWTEEPDD